MYSADLALIEPLSHLVRAAGARIMADYRQDFVVRMKADGSPATLTDEAAENIIIEGLRALSPHPIIAEEQVAANRAPTLPDPQGPFWLVDALDGTRDFIKGQPDFTVNIALIDGGRPVLGLIYAPVHGALYHAVHGHGAFKDGRMLRMQAPQQQALRLFGGKRSSAPVVLEPFIGAHTIESRQQRSSSLKFCVLAEGQGDVYPRLGETYEWDTAAGDVIVRESGGVVLDLASAAPLAYGKTHVGFLNTGFIALHADLLASQITAQAQGGHGKGPVPQG